jgi:hypothetical protein
VYFPRGSLGNEDVRLREVFREILDRFRTEEMDMTIDPQTTGHPGVVGNLCPPTITRW